MGWIYYLITWILSMSYLVILHLSGKTVTVGSVSVLEVWVCLRDFLHPLSSFYLFLFYFCCFFQCKTFYFFWAFHVFIQVDGFATIENFLAICIAVWSVLLYVCKVLLYNGALSHSLQSTCCCSVPLSHVGRSMEQRVLLWEERCLHRRVLSHEQEQHTHESCCCSIDPITIPAIVSIILVQARLIRCG